MTSTVGVRVEMGPRYRGRALSSTGEQALSVCLEPQGILRHWTPNLL
jgi:hypothetical protein